MGVNVDAVLKKMEEAGMNQLRFANKAGLSKGYVSKVFSGKRGGGGAFIDGLCQAFPDEDVRNFMVTEKCHERRECERCEEEGL